MLTPTKKLRGVSKKNLILKIRALEAELELMRSFQNDKKTAKAVTEEGRAIIKTVTSKSVFDPFFGQKVQKVELVPQLTLEEKNLALAKQKLEAIRMIKQRTGMDLKKAKDLVDKWLEQNPNVVKAGSFGVPINPPLPEYPDNGHRLSRYEIDDINRGLKLQAIKSIKSRTKLGLKECKDMVDVYCARKAAAKF
jgi:ribosomal protein L7/L12